MYDKDPFSNPNYGPNYGPGYGVQKKGKIDINMKKYLKIGGIIVALIIIAILVWTFFIGNNQEVRIEITNSEGESISSTITLKQNDEIIKRERNKTSLTQTLKVGTYDLSVEADGYKNVEREIDTSEEEITVIMYKDIDVELTAQQTSMNVFQGATTNIELTLLNKKDTTETIELDIEDTENELNVEIIPVTIQLNGKVSTGATIKITPKETTKIKNSINTKLEIKIKETKIKQEIDVIIFPKPDIEIYKFEEEINVGAEAEFEIEIKNNGDKELGEIELEIEITQGKESNKTTYLQWIKFVQSSEPEKWKIKIPKIGAKERLKIPLRIQVPLTAQENDIISGIIKANAIYAPQGITQSFKLETQEKLKEEISLTIKNNFTISWDDTLGRYEDEYTELRVKNEGEIDIENLEIYIENAGDCGTSWITFTPNTILIEKVLKGETKTIQTRISAPTTIRGIGAEKACRLKWKYLDPSGSGTKDDPLNVKLITIFAEP